MDEGNEIGGGSRGCPTPRKMSKGRGPDQDEFMVDEGSNQN